LIGEDLATFRGSDDRWLEQHSTWSSTDNVTHELTTASDSVDNCPIPLDTTRWPAAKLRPNPLNPRGELDPTGIDELAASVSLAGDNGAKVRTSLAAKAQALRVKGLAEVEAATRVGVRAACRAGVLGNTAGNYRGRLRPFPPHLQRLPG